MRRTQNAQRAEQRQIHSATVALPAPVGGWNVRDPESAMPATDALHLENWYPQAGYCVTRDGAIRWKEGLENLIRTLVPYNGRSGSQLFAIANDSVQNVTGSGGSWNEVFEGITSPAVQHTQYGTSAGSFLYIVNGVDNPVLYDGTTWTTITTTSTPALTGGPALLSSLAHVHGFKRRLFFLERNKLNFWYLAPDAIGGELFEFQLGPLCRRGGYTVAMATWTIDGGSGADDFAVFITSEGEVVVFSGSDPGTVGDWFLVGVYYIARPMGRNCFVKYGGDLLIITELGIFPLSTALKPAGKLSLSTKIDPAFSEAARLYKRYHGWHGLTYPKQNALIINIPIGNRRSMQFVMNMITKAWTKFTGWDTESMVEFNGDLFYADVPQIDFSHVNKAWTGVGDVGNPVTYRAIPAYSYFGTRGLTKRVNLFQPVYRLRQSVDLNYGVNTDFVARGVESVVTLDPPVGASLWDTAEWDEGIWGASGVVSNRWLTPLSRTGFAHSIETSISAETAPIEWLATNCIVESGTLL